MWLKKNLLSAIVILTVFLGCSNQLPTLSVFRPQDELPNGRILTEVEKDELTSIYPLAREIFIEAFATEDAAKALEGTEPETYHVLMMEVYEKQNQLLRGVFGEAANDMIGVIVTSNKIISEEVSKGFYNDDMSNGYIMYCESSCWYNGFGRWNSAVTAFRNSSLVEIPADYISVSLYDNDTGLLTRTKTDTARVTVDGFFYWWRAACDPLTRTTEHKIRDDYTGTTSYIKNYTWND